MSAPTSSDFKHRIETALQTTVLRSVPLSGGCIGDVRAFDLNDGRRVVAKTGGTNLESGLDLEGWMLSYLATHSALPVPDVLVSDPDLLVMSHIETSGSITASVERDAADHLATLHGITGDAFGLNRDTVIGGLPQPNTPSEKWIAFFAEQRLMYMAQDAVDAGRLSSVVMGRVETLCGRLDQWLTEPDAPRLIHGDMWTGNVLCREGRIAGFVDPAIYYADPEIELAFATLFGTFGEAFFDRYTAHRPLAPGFFEQRKELYNLYPLLVHVRLFGGSYVASVERTLSAFGV